MPPNAWCNGQILIRIPKNVDRIYTKRVGLLGDLANFDPLEFGVVPNASTRHGT